MDTVLEMTSGGVISVAEKHTLIPVSRTKEKDTTAKVKIPLERHFRDKIIGLGELTIVMKMKRLVMMKTRGGFGFLSISGESPIKSNAQRGTRCRK